MGARPVQPPAQSHCEAFKHLTKGGHVARSYRNMKNWLEKVPALTPEALAPIQKSVNDDQVETWVTLKDVVDLEQNMLYGVAQDARPEFWAAMKTAREHAVKLLYVREHENGGTLAVIHDALNEQHDYWDVPCDDIAPAGPEVVARVKVTIAEKERLKRLRDTLMTLPAAAHSMNASAQTTARELLRQTEAVARIAYGVEVAAPPRVRPTQVDKLLERFDRVEVYSPALEQQRDPQLLLLRCVKEHLVMKYVSEKTGKVHPSLDGTSVDLGKMVIEIGMRPEEHIRGLKNYTMRFAIWGKKHPRFSLMHPHIQTSTSNAYAEDKTLSYASPCLGSYGTRLDEQVKKADVIGVMDTLWDYLTSCSENGWYNSFVPWLPADLQKQYCACGKLHWSETREPRCGSCGTSRPDPKKEEVA